MKNLVILFALSLLISLINSEMLFDDTFSGEFDPSDEMSKWVFNGLDETTSAAIPKGLKFNKCVTGKHNTFGRVIVNPVKRPSDMVPGWGWYSNELCSISPKFVNSAPLTVKENQVVSISATMAVQRMITNNHPFGSLITGVFSDPRPGACGIVMYSPSTGVSSGIFLTSTSIWSYHSRQNYPLRPLSDIKGFFNMKKLGSRTATNINMLRIEYHRPNNIVKYYVDGTMRRGVRNVGSIDQEEGVNVAVYNASSNAVTSSVTMPDIKPIFTCMTHMDKTDPHDRHGYVGLINHYTDDELFSHPTKWFSTNADSETDRTLHEFGQSLDAQIKRFSVEIKNV